MAESTFVLTDSRSESLVGWLNSIQYSAREFSSEDVFLSALESGPEPICALINLSDMNRALRVQHDALERGIKTPFLFVVDRSDESIPVAAVRRGAIIVLERPLSKESLQSAIEEVSLLSKAYQAFVESGLHRSRLAALSARERRIVQLAADGTPNKRIASILGLSVKTVEKQRRQAYQRLNVSSTAEMTRAVTLGNLHPLLRSGQTMPQA